MNYRRKVAMLYMLGLAIDLVNIFVINAAYPTIQRELNASVTQLAWIGNIYALGLTVVIPLGTWLALRLGERRLMLTSLLVFAASSLGVALAGSVDSLLAWRLLQGMGGGLLIPVGQTMAYRVYPVDERARLTSMVMMVALLVPALSPALGGVIVDHLSWRSIFLAMIPLTLAIAALARCWLAPDDRHARRVKLDAKGLCLSVAALLFTLLGLTFLAQGANWPLAIAALGIGLLAAGLFVAHARHSPAPLLQLKLLEQPLLRTGMVIYQCIPGTFAGLNMVAALYFQKILHLSAAQTGALMLPWAFGAFVAILATRRVFPARGGRPLILAGILINAIGIVLLATPWAAGGAARIVSFLAMGMGATLCSSSAQSGAFIETATEQMGDASALWNINRQLSFCLGVVLIGGALEMSLSHYGNDLWAAYRSCFLLAALLAVVPLPFVVRLPKRDAAQSFPNVS